MELSHGLLRTHHLSHKKNCHEANYNDVTCNFPQVGCNINALLITLEN